MDLANIQIFNRVTGRDRAFLARQLATMLGSGLAINKSVAILASQEKNHTLKRVLLQIQQDLENGIPFSTAIAKHPKIFDRVFSNVVISGEAVGNLSKVLTQLAEQLERTVNFTAKVKGAFSYPSFVVAMMIIVGIIMMVYIVPQIEQVFTEAGAQLPWTTRTIIAISHFISTNWQVVLLMLFLVGVGIYAYVKSKAGEKVIDKIKIHLPTGLGYDIYMARFTRTLGMLIQGGTPIIEAINVTSTVMNNVYYRTLLESATEEVRKGAPLSVPLGRSELFSVLVSQMILVGEQTGSIDQTLLNLADYYEEVVDTKLKNLSALIEPIIIVIIGFGVGFLVFSILVPIYDLAQL